MVNLVAGVVLLGVGMMFVGGAGLIPGLFLIGSALAAYRVPEELPGRAAAGRAVLRFVAASLLVWWLSPVIAGGPEIPALKVVQPLLMSCAYMTGVMLALHTPLRAPLTAVLAPLGRTALTNYLLATVAFVVVGRAIGLEGSDRWGAAIALGAGILVVQAWSARCGCAGSGTGRWSGCGAARPGGGGCRSACARCGPRPDGATIARGDRRREEPDGVARDRLARLGVRSPAGRDAVAAAVLAVLGLAGRCSPWS